MFHPPMLRPLLVAFLLFRAAAPAWAYDPAPVAGKHGVVTSAQGLATDAGIEVMRAGGNAVDAAVAVGYALAVTYPAAGNLGGGGFMTLRLADGSLHFLDFRERAPLAATPTMFVDAAGAVVPGRSTDSWLAVGMPGSIAGLEEARRRWGTLDRATLMAPAIRLARDGFVLTPGDAPLFKAEAKDLAKDPAAAAIFTRDGKPLGVGDRLVQPDLARTLEQLAGQGPDAFYRGSLGEAFLRASEAGGGLFTAEDLRRYRVRDPAPIECGYRQYRVVSAAPPSSGGVALCEMLGILEGFDLRALGYRSAAGVHVQAEAMARAFFDRNNRLGDPDFVNNDAAGLLAPERIRAAREAITGRHHLLTPEDAGREGSNTTHYGTADAAGNAVSVTTTLNGWFGVRKVVPGTGIVLNNEMDDFAAAPGRANQFGLVQAQNNAPGAGKAPLSSMSPTLLLKGGQPVAVLGSPGGPRIITTVLHLVLGLIDYDMSLQEAVDAPRFHQQWMPDRLLVERFALSPDTRRELEGRGHTVVDSVPWGIANAIAIGSPRLGAPPPASSAQSLILTDPATAGFGLFAAPDPRGGAATAQGW